MAYIGQSIKNGTFSVLDTSGNTYNGSNTAFNLGTQVGSPAQLLVSHDGVIQKPGTDYTLSSGGAAITFSTAPASGAAIFIVEISGAIGGPMNRDLNGEELILDVDGDSSIHADTDDQIDFKTGGTDRVVIASDGDVGIGTASPDGSSFSASSSPILDVSGTRPLIILSETDSNTKKAWLGMSSDSFFVGGTNTSTQFYTDNTKRMELDSNGILTISGQPAFLAKGSGTQSNLTDGTTLLFASEKFDKNGDYNASNSTFTAPVAGIYIFTTILRIEDFNNDATYIQISLEGSNDTQQIIYSGNNQSGDPTYLPFTISYIAECDASDTVTLQWKQSGGSTSSDLHSDSSFSGHLLS